MTELTNEAVDAPDAVESNKHWYIVQTYSGYENKAKQALEDRIRLHGMEEFFEEVYIPAEQVTEVRNGKKRQVTRKVFNSYIFVKMELNDQAWHIVKDTPKVVGFLGGLNNDGRDPQPVPDEQVRQISERIEEGALKTSTSYNFSQGDKVRVIEGNFKDFTGTVEEVNEEKEKLRVFVEIFGRPTSVEFDFDQVTGAEG